MARWWFRTGKRAPRLVGKTVELPEVPLHTPVRSLIKARPIGVFVSHRWEYDRETRDLLAEFNHAPSGIRIEDHSLPKEERITSPRGKNVADIRVKAEIARRMRMADVVVAPSIAMRNPSDWVMWELELAALGMQKPILFVDHVQDLKLPTRLIAALRREGARVARARWTSNRTVDLTRALYRVLGMVVTERDTQGARPEPVSSAPDGNQPSAP